MARNKRNRSIWLGVNRRVRRAWLHGHHAKAAHYGLRSFRRYQRWYKA